MATIRRSTSTIRMDTETARDIARAETTRTAGESPVPSGRAGRLDAPTGRPFIVVMVERYHAEKHVSSYYG